MKAEIEKLEKEIKNLKLIQETNEKQIQNDIKDREELRNNLMLTENDRDERKLKATDLWEENKKLKNELAEQIGGGNGLMDEIDFLKRENKKLKKKMEQIQKYTEQKWIKLKETQLENYRLKKQIEIIKKCYPLLFEKGQPMGEPYGKGIPEMLKEKGIDISNMEDDTIQELIDIGEIEYEGGLYD